MGKTKARQNGKHPGGRPPLYDDPSALDARIAEYFLQGKGDILFAPTITGLVLYCGFVSRASFYEYEKIPEFSDSIKRARAMIEAVYERRLHGSNATGAIFALKNFGWTDQQPESQSPVVIQVVVYGEQPADVSVTRLSNGNGAHG